MKWRDVRKSVPDPHCPCIALTQNGELWLAERRQKNGRFYDYYGHEGLLVKVRYWVEIENIPDVVFTQFAPLP